ncbi:SDR family oxidoreductase [Parvularcula sp. ZS-1/3]|uniref:SDR family oxidoreductase n=1 Tax=Parvularcula mediterranea TaxID=2732508 RepID=A0A7Y3W557_9PROT|nr:SDR family oxidoreductase [Parvularcula mediterranea]NNU15906.1 SDR family oxidoreductase [Parvularcula mediterranea]
MRVLVAGATGKTGRLLVRDLKEQGHEPVAMVRESSDTSVLPEGTETRLADLSDLPGDVAADVDAVIFAAGSGGDTDEEMTRKIDRDGAKALIDKAAEAKIKRFVMLSSKGADTPEQAPDGMACYLEAKHAADVYLRDAGMEFAIVRPVALTDDQGKGMIELAGHVEGEEIARADVARVLTAATEDASIKGKTFEIASGSTLISDAMKTV